MNRVFPFSCFCVFMVAPALVDDAVPRRRERIAFFVCGDPQYLAEHAEAPTKLDPLSEEANSRFAKIVNSLPEASWPRLWAAGSSRVICTA